jgi:hypothetical protein
VRCRVEGRESRDIFGWGAMVLDVLRLGSSTRYI